MEKALYFLKEYLKKDEVVVCATSGGIDSMALLYLLLELRKEININIICAHINHNLREESFEEYEFVEKYCKQNNIIFEGILFEKHKHGNFEFESRKKRYNFFEFVLNKYSSRYLLTAHHGDDLIETVLMRLIRGSTLDGYMGFDMISDRNDYKILRPLIYYTKSDIKNYANQNNIEYREDKTNSDIKYTRNRYRKKILPLFKEENKDVHLKFLKFNNIIKESSTFINNYTNKVYEQIYIDNKININSIKDIDTFILKKVLLKILAEIYRENISYINDKHILAILEVLKSNKSNISINLPLEMIAEKSYDYFEIKEVANVESYKIEIRNSEIILPNGILKKVNDTKLTNNYVCHLDSSKIKLPLFVRNKNPGDFIEVLGLNGKKKVKDIFINEKVKKDIRSSYPVVVDSNNTVLWVPGLKKSKYDSLKTKNYDIILWYIDEEEKYE